MHLVPDQRTAGSAAPRRVRELTPAAGTAVMATGILSVGLQLTGHHSSSLVALTLAGALWVLLAGVFTGRLLGDRARLGREAVTPAALTAVAATGVLGTRLSLAGRQPLAACALVLAAAIWPVLLTTVIRHWKRRMPGVVFLVCVATQSLAVLAATLAVPEQAAWLCWPALACLTLGLLLYGAALARFDLRQVRTGAGDHWVAAGALAISALAGAKLTAACDPHGALGWAGSLYGTLRALTLALLALNLAACLLLLCAELRWPRPHYDLRRWATVFPLGMTAVAVLSTSTAAHLPWLATLGRPLLWLAVAAWLLTAAGAVRSHLGRPPQ